MIKLLIKLSVLLLFVVFSSLWISDKLYMVSNEKNQDLYEQSEKNAGENTLESKSKTLLLASIESINCFDYDSFESRKINSFDSFLIKEFVLQNLTPPPEQA
ncbi:hypothetical protein [Flavobacterium caseinilyticum]|uniref:Uncharacterized protein n=1 Tax=Flavobacterium caseinilyticum TaxID=2541732 RepID=A0A4R5AXD7_9FLAO|nr:hypothetical protein [Flavobacterium caseinilyticum]TDD77503.1 hypothetical protein E0F89_07940 [Flavobacterium caseinilyticum]